MAKQAGTVAAAGTLSALLALGAGAADLSNGEEVLLKGCM